jgi:hypothetical protein
MKTEIENRVQRDLIAGTNVSGKRVFSDLLALEERILKCLDSLSSRMDKLVQPVFSSEENVRRNSWWPPGVQLQVVREFLVELYREFLQSYRAIVQANFAGLEELFPLANRRAIRILVSCTQNSGPQGLFVDVRIFQLEEDGPTDVVEAVEDTIKEYRQEKLMVDHAGRQWVVISISDHGLQNYFVGKPKLHSPNFSRMTLRNMVYGKLIDEFPLFSAEFLKRHGVR